NDLEIIIKCKQVDDQVKKIIDYFEDKISIVGKINERVYQIDVNDIFYLEANEEKVFIYGFEKVYESNLRLYELEAKLENYNFIRISKSVILNLDKLVSVKAYLNGRYEALLINNERVIITRHYVSNFKHRFGM
uniref:LytTR family DNA-binding domain-containing protein n=1 Tax=Thomasclavelia sp. TaxID=3025757 RepID=UPI0025FC17F5